MKFSDTVAEVIDLATAIRDYWDTELPKRHPNYPIVSPDEDSGPAPPEQQKLKQLLAGLPDEEIYKLTLIMNLGRGDFASDDLTRQLGILKKRFAKSEWAVIQLMGKAALADYLMDGLAELKKSGIDVDHLATNSVGAEN